MLDLKMKLDRENHHVGWLSVFMSSTLDIYLLLTLCTCTDTDTFFSFIKLDLIRKFDYVNNEMEQHELFADLIISYHINYIRYSF